MAAGHDDNGTACARSLSKSLETQGGKQDGGRHYERTRINSSSCPPMGGGDPEVRGRGDRRVLPHLRRRGGRVERQRVRPAGGRRDADGHDLRRRAHLRRPLQPGGDDGGAGPPPDRDRRRGPPLTAYPTSPASTASTNRPPPSAAGRPCRASDPAGATCATPSPPSSDQPSPTQTPASPQLAATATQLRGEFPNGPTATLRASQNAQLHDWPDALVDAISGRKTDMTSTQ